MRKIALANIDKLFAAVAATEKLYLPVDTKAGAQYDVWAEGKQWSHALNTVRSPKGFFFPQTENLMDFKMEGKKIEIIDIREESEDFVVFGVRPCDVKSFEVLDRVFLAEPADTYYQNRRTHGVIVSVACNKPSETCFCHTFGIDASEPQGDAACWMDADNLYIRANTEKGEAFLKVIESVTEACDDTAADAQKEIIKARLEKLPLRELSVEAFGAGKTDEFFNRPEWNELFQSCIGCGTCTFVCPTCQCYDIRDFDTGHGIQRYRCWDSCMYSAFTKMSAGQPRNTQKERFRQRFMHKLVYYPTNNDGLFSCVGCGRCVNKCPVQMNIVKVIKKLGGNK